LTVGTRGSKLSLVQTNHVLEALKLLRPNVEFEVKIIKTLGDKEQSLSLFSLDRKGIFEKEIDLAIQNGEVDFAVHSLKDVPILEHSVTTIAAIPKRNSPNDVLISKDNVPFAELPENGVVGTSSLRRMAQVKHLRPDLEAKPIRGNVDTRVRKIKRGESLTVAEQIQQNGGQVRDVKIESDESTKENKFAVSLYYRYRQSANEGSI